MATLLGVFFVGVSFFPPSALVPGNQTIVSQVALSVFGQNAFYYLSDQQWDPVVAANTAFADFPRLSSVLPGQLYAAQF